MSNPVFPSFTNTYHHSRYSDIAPGKPALSAAGNVILITGGGTGIGKAIAAAFIEAQATAVMLVGRTEATLKETQAELSRKGTSSISYTLADITDPKAVEAAFSITIRLYGAVDVLVNNAGYLSVHVPLGESSLDDYWRGFEINIKGPIVATQCFLKVARPGATLINISSGAAHIPYIPGYSGYSSAKLATARIMEYVHQENSALRVFNVQPGAIETNMAKGAPDLRTEDNAGMC